MDVMGTPKGKPDRGSCLLGGGPRGGGRRCGGVVGSSTDNFLCRAIVVSDKAQGQVSKYSQAEHKATGEGRWRLWGAGPGDWRSDLVNGGGQQ